MRFQILGVAADDESSGSRPDLTAPDRTSERVLQRLDCAEHSLRTIEDMLLRSLTRVELPDRDQPRTTRVQTVIALGTDPTRRTGVLSPPRGAAPEPPNGRRKETAAVGPPAEQRVLSPARGRPTAPERPSANVLSPAKLRPFSVAPDQHAAEHARSPRALPTPVPSAERLVSPQRAAPGRTLSPQQQRSNTAAAAAPVTSASAEAAVRALSPRRANSRAAPPDLAAAAASAASAAAAFRAQSPVARPALTPSGPLHVSTPSVGAPEDGETDSMEALYGFLVHRGDPPQPLVPPAGLPRVQLDETLFPRDVIEGRFGTLTKHRYRVGAEEPNKKPRRKKNRMISAQTVCAS